MGEIGTNCTTSPSTADGVTHGTRAAQEDALTGLCQRISWCGGGGALRFQPVLELNAGLRYDEERHLCVLVTAELGALSTIDASRIGPEPGACFVTRNQILLSIEVRRPKAVNHVVGRHLDEDRASDGNVN